MLEYSLDLHMFGKDISLSEFLLEYIIELDCSRKSVVKAFIASVKCFFYVEIYLLYL